MGRKPCCEKESLNRGAWTAQEDKLLSDYIQSYGEGKWNSIPRRAGLRRCGKSCRLRWLNYLRPDIKRGNITLDEEDLIVRLHRLLGNRWSLIAGRLPGRTDNEIKNYWNTNLSKKLEAAAERKMAAVRGSPATCDEKQPKSAPIKATALKFTGSFGVQDDSRDQAQLMGSNSDESSAVYLADMAGDPTTSFDFSELERAEDGGAWRSEELFRGGGYSFMSKEAAVEESYGGGEVHEGFSDFNFLSELLEPEGGWMEEL